MSRWPFDRRRVAGKTEEHICENIKEDAMGTPFTVAWKVQGTFWTAEQKPELEYEADDNIKLGSMILVAKYVQKEKLMDL